MTPELAFAISIAVAPPSKTIVEPVLASPRTVKLIVNSASPSATLTPWVLLSNQATVKIPLALLVTLKLLAFRSIKLKLSTDSN